MTATLYVIPGSHPSMAVRLMLEHKGIEYRRVDLMPVIARAVLKALRFPGITVPALKLDGRRIQPSVQITRELDRLRPEPPLFPGDPERRTSPLSSGTCPGSHQGSARIGPRPAT
jgi:glutathione S-transferase